MGTVKYDAFISYRHSEPDSYAAQTLHRQLENFRLPAGLARRMAAQTADGEQTAQTGAWNGRTRIRRVFRDREELPLVANLADPITEALRDSEYLIVICSPRLPESMWCRQEIETFIRLHDREHVLAVLVEGEPDTSFPEELLWREEEEKQPDGSVIKKKVAVEPLAADVRGADRREIRKKLKSELLRLVAPMFGCSYDDLRQRHRERRMRKIIVTSVSISAACLLFGIVSTTMALRIRRQNTQISEQSAEIAAQAQEIEAQYREAKRNTAVARAKEAKQYLEDGDRMRAVATAQDALSDLAEDGMTGAGIDYPPETVYALTDSLYLYENGQQILPDRILEADNTVQVMKMSPEGGRILTVDATGQVTVWSAADVNARIVPCTMPAYTYLDAETLVDFRDENSVYALTEEGMALYDLSGEKAVERYCVRQAADGSGKILGIIALREQDRAVLLTEDGYLLFDGADGSILYERAWELPEGLGAAYGGACAGSADGAYWAAELLTEEGERDESAVILCDTATGTVQRIYSLPYTYVEELRFVQDRLYILNNGSGGADRESYAVDMESRLYAYDLHGADTPLWTYALADGWLYDIAAGTGSGTDYLLCQGYDRVDILDPQDGRLLYRFWLGSEVTKLWYAESSGMFMAFTRDGIWHYLNADSREDMVGMLFPACTSANVKTFAIGDGYCVTLPYGSRQITVYRTAVGDGVQVFHEKQEGPAGSLREAALSADGAYLAVAYSGVGRDTEICLLDAGSGDVLWNYTDADYYGGMLFVDCNGQERLALLTNRRMLQLDVSTGEVVSSCTHEEYGLRASLTVVADDAASGHVLLRDFQTLYDCDLSEPSGISITEFSAGQELSYSDIVAAPDGFPYYAVADTEAGSLCFCRDGQVFYTYDGGTDPLQEGYVNFRYLRTMFFGGSDTDRRLYLVSLDGRVTVMRLAADTDAPDFCEVDREASAKYEGLEDDMAGYEAYEGGLAVLWGTEYAYLLTQDGGDILARLHGFLAYDAVNGQIYLRKGTTVCRTPLYSVQEIAAAAEETLRTGERHAER